MKILSISKRTHRYYGTAGFFDLKNMSITFTASSSQNTITNQNIEFRLQNEALGAGRSYSRRSLLIEKPLETSSEFGTGFTHQSIMIATNQPLACLQAFNEIMSIQVGPTEYSLYYRKLSYTEFFLWGGSNNRKHEFCGVLSTSFEKVTVFYPRIP